MDMTALVMIFGVTAGAIPVARYLIKKTLKDIDHWL